MTFTDYLTYAKSQLSNLDQFRLIRIVLGNESCDLDSTISACVYSYFLHSICLNQHDILHLPILNTKLSKFRLRTEIRWFLKENFSNLIFIDDIDLNELYKQKKLEIILVDHHYLRSKLNDIVIEIIDHHQIKQDSIVLQNQSAIKIEPVGSCCTLIAEKLLSANFQINDQIAYLLIGPILFDTVCFSSDVGKATEKDREIYAKLKQYYSLPLDDLKLFTDLKTSSSDISGLTIEDLLQKDAKQVIGLNIRLIMSSLPMNYSAQKLIDNLQTGNVLNEFLLKNENADGLIITSIDIENNETKRQLAFYTCNCQLFKSIDDFLRSYGLDLDLHERSLSTNEINLKLFDQHNVRASRKQILPLFEQFIKQIDSSKIDL